MLWETTVATITGIINEINVATKRVLAVSFHLSASITNATRAKPMDKNAVSTVIAAKIP